jgi:hypothetical protein
MEENLELVKRLATSYGTRRHMTVCKALHLSSLPLAISVHSTHFHPIYKAHLIFYHLRLDLPNGPFPLAFPTKIPYAFLSFLDSLFTDMKMLFMLCYW